MADSRDTLDYPGRSSYERRRNVTRIDICASPIFVVGAPRSGTSMMQWALRQHPELWGGQESDYLIPLFERLREIHEFGSRRGRLHWLSGQKVALEEFVKFIGMGINALYSNRAGGRRWVEQTPQYTLHLEQMATYFPGARFLFMLRDGRQVVASLRNFVEPLEHEEACRTWATFVRAGLTFARSELGTQMRIVRYESIVSETEATIRDICTFLGESFCEKSVEFIGSKRINSSFEAKPADALRPRWMTWSTEERRSFHALAGELLIELGYAPDPSWLETPPEVSV
jgi:hypothetical protein